MSRIAVVCEDISTPLDEGFKKASTCIARALAELGHQTVVYTRDPAHAAIPSQILPGNKLLRGKTFARTLKAAKPDFILYIPEAAATPMSLIRARSLRRQAGGVPVVVLSLQRRDYSTFARLFLKLIQPDLLLVLSAERLSVMAGMGFRVSRIPLGVDAAIFEPPGPGEKEALRDKYGIGNERVILHVGHLSAGRNIRLLRRLTSLGVKVALVSSTATSPDREVKSLLESPSVTLIDGFVEDISEVYKLADAYAFPTFSQTGAIEIPLSVLEAMAVNLPVVTTDFGGLCDLFSEGKGLFICSSEDEFLSKAKEMFAVQQVQTRQMVEGLSWKHVAEAIMEAVEPEVL